MDFNFWKERWETGRIGFHQAEVDRHLARFADRLVSPHASGIVVPLCGKTIDLTWLSERFARVVGVEFVESAVADYYAERGVTPEVTRVGAMPRYQGGGVTMLAGDFHEVTLAHTGPVDRAFDRAAMIALPPHMRPRYAAHMLSLLPPGGRVLLVTLSYDRLGVSEPPFPVHEDEVRALYAHTCDLEILATEPTRSPPQRLANEAVKTSVWLITKH